MKTIIPYPGGKAMHFEWIYQFFPPHKIYVEVFGGSGAIILNKSPSQIEVYNDIDQNLVSFFRVLQDYKKSQILYRKLKYTLYSREELYRAYDIINNKSSDEIERAWAVYVLTRMGFGARMYSPTFSVNLNESDKSKSNTFYSSLRYIVEFKKRLENIIVENLDWEECMEKYDTEETLFYLDPPYPIEVINSNKLYIQDKGFKTLEEHRIFLEKLKKFKGMIILSGYDNKVYDDVLKDWKKEYKKTYSPIGAFYSDKIEKVKKLTYNEKMEVLWINPQCQAMQKQLKLFWNY